MPDRTAAQEASAYFNSLPIEQRRRLAPLLEDYRLLGMREYAQAIDAARSAMSKRMRALAAEPSRERCGINVWRNSRWADHCTLPKGHTGAHQVVHASDEQDEPSA